MDQNQTLTGSILSRDPSSLLKPTNKQTLSENIWWVCILNIHHLQSAESNYLTKTGTNTVGILTHVVLLWKLFFNYEDEVFANYIFIFVLHRKNWTQTLFCCTFLKLKWFRHRSAAATWTLRDLGSVNVKLLFCFWVKHKTIHKR